MAYGPGLPIKGEFHLGGATAAANTAFLLGVPPAPPFSPKLRNCFTRVMSVSFISGSTANQLYCMSPLGSTTVATAGVAGGTTAFSLTADPGVSMKGPNGTASQLPDNALAGGDYFCVELPDGTYWFDKVASGTYAAVVPTTTIPTNGFAVGATFWWFGIQTDKNPMTGFVHPLLTPPVSARTKYDDLNIGAFGGCRPYEPLYFYCANLTGQCWIDQCVAAYCSH